MARSIAGSLGADLIEAKNVDPATLSVYDLIGFGSGIFKGKFHAQLPRFVCELPQASSKAFIFSTSGLGKKAITTTSERCWKQKDTG